jgi:16S rRNA (guanine966-N2)-methyltransferase
MRITGGSGKGRRLRVPAGSRVRPSSDKVKQALFNILGEKVRNAAFLDLFSGTGAVGIEALSRGAGRVVFVDDARESLKATRQNIEQSGVEEQATVVPAKAESYLKKTEEQFDVVFLDPPYSYDQEQLLNLVSASAIVKQDSVIVYEHFKKSKLPEETGRLVLYREAVYGDTVLSFYEVKRQNQEAGSR